MSTIKNKIAADYLELLNRFPLAPIKSKEQLKDAFALVDELAIIDEDRLTPGQADYLLVVSNLVEQYEDAHFPNDTIS